MLPICTWTVLMGQVLTLGVDMMNLLLSFLCCTSSQGRFKRSQAQTLHSRISCSMLCSVYLYIFQGLKKRSLTEPDTDTRGGNLGSYSTLGMYYIRPILVVIMIIGEQFAHCKVSIQGRQYARLMSAVKEMRPVLIRYTWLMVRSTKIKRNRAKKQTGA